MQLTIYDILILVGVPSIISFIFQMLLRASIKNAKKAKDTDILITRAMQVLLRDRLRELYTKHNRAGYIDIADKDIFDSMFKIYHCLGENGVMDGIYAKVMELPTTKQKKKEIK